MSEELRVLTTRQPFASLIIYGVKDVENRSRRTHCQGQLLIHAGKAWSAEGWDRVLECADKAAPKWDLQLMRTACHAMAWRGFILGTVDLVDCVQDSSSEWAEDDMYHWILENPQPFDEPIPWRGQQGLWQITEAELETARKEVQK